MHSNQRNNSVFENQIIQSSCKSSFFEKRKISLSAKGHTARSLMTSHMNPNLQKFDINKV